MGVRFNLLAWSFNGLKQPMATHANSSLNFTMGFVHVGRLFFVSEITSQAAPKGVQREPIMLIDYTGLGIYEMVHIVEDELE